MLTALETTIATVLADPDESLDTYGIVAKRRKLKDLFDARDRLRAELARSQNRRFAGADRRGGL